MLSIGICHKCPFLPFCWFFGGQLPLRRCGTIIFASASDLWLRVPTGGKQVWCSMLYCKFENKSPLLEVHTRQIFRCQVIAVETTPIFLNIWMGLRYQKVCFRWAMEEIPLPWRGWSSMVHRSGAWFDWSQIGRQGLSQCFASRLTIGCRNISWKGKIEF